MKEKSREATKEKLKDDRARAIEEEIKNDQRHRDLANLCIFPFQLAGRIYEATGYAFVSVDPLLGQGVKNFDVLVYSSKSQSAILIECKPHIWDPQKAIEEISEKIKVAENQHSMLEDFVGSQIKHKEYVLAVLAVESPKIDEIDESDRADVVLWLCDLYGSLIRMHPNFMKHANGDLSRFFGKGVRIEGANRIVNIMPSSHMCTVLEIISGILETGSGEGSRGRFSFSGLCEILKKEIRNYPESGIISLAEKAANSGMKIGILREEATSRGERHFTLTERTKNVKARYIEFHSEEHAEGKIKEVPPKDVKRIEEYL